MSKTTKAAQFPGRRPSMKSAQNAAAVTDKPARNDQSSKSGQVSYAEKPDGNDQDNKTGRFPTRVNLRKMIRAAKMRRFPALLTGKL
jgi:hypothetical protein